MTNKIKSIPASPAARPSARGCEHDGDVLLPLLGAPTKPVDAGGTMIHSLPGDDNGDTLLPLMGDEDKAQAHGNTHHNPTTKE